MEKSLKKLLLNTKYTIHYYQKEYMWQRKQIAELIDDLTTEFLENQHENVFSTCTKRMKIYDHHLIPFEQVIVGGFMRGNRFSWQTTNHQHTNPALTHHLTNDTLLNITKYIAPNIM